MSVPRSDTAPRPVGVRRGNERSRRTSETRTSTRGRRWHAVQRHDSQCAGWTLRRLAPPAPRSRPSWWRPCAASLYISIGMERTAADIGRRALHGLAIAERTQASARVVELFAFLHDARRRDEWSDPAHGRRSAELVRELGSRVLRISDEEVDLLAYACHYHSDGRMEGDVTVQLCWDADRLDLGRVGIRPDPARLCTGAARQLLCSNPAGSPGIAEVPVGGTEPSTLGPDRLLAARLDCRSHLGFPATCGKE